jgi:pimeloyl-ACP methyl ester carboxylesterase
MDYLYLHGFASSPQSRKAQRLQARFQTLGLTLHVLDLNQDDFTGLTLSRQRQQCLDWMAERQTVSVIGSSFGGLTAAWLAQHPDTQGRIQRLVLLAPAFQFLAQWLPRLGAERLADWRHSRRLSVYHYGFGMNLPLDYGFVTDAETYDEAELTVPLPTLILHGQQDEVIDIAASRAYARDRPWVTLIPLDSDHALANVEGEIWTAVHRFLQLSAAA